MEFEGKYGASIVTSGGGDEKPIMDYMNHFLITTGIHPVGGIWATMGNLTDEIFTDEICRKAFELGEKLVLSWKHKKRSKSVEKRLAAFRQRMQWLMIYRKDQWPYEYKFWQNYKGLK
jgi:hypothetical protein